MHGRVAGPLASREVRSGGEASDEDGDARDATPRQASGVPGFLISVVGRSGWTSRRGAHAAPLISGRVTMAGVRQVDH